MNPIIPDSQPAPSRGSTAIAAGILAAGYGPEKIAYIVEGFRCAAELEQEIATAMAVLQAAPEALGMLLGGLAAGDGPGTGDGAAVHGLSCGCPECDNDEAEPYCVTCAADVGIFIGHGDAWLHYTGEGTVASPVELYDAGHAPEVAWRPAGAR